MRDHDELYNVTLGDLATRCDALPPTTSAMEVEKIFDADATRSSVVVRGRRADCILVARGEFYQHLTGRLGYGYALHRHRPVVEMQLKPAPSFSAGTTAVDAGLQLIEQEQIGASSVVLVRHDDGSVATASTQEVLAHLGRTFHRKVDALESSDRRFRSMLANVNEVICLVGRGGSVVWVSETVSGVLGLWPAAVVGTQLSATVLGDEQARADAALEEVLAGRRTHLTGDVTITDGFGRRRIVEVHASNRLDDPALEAVVVNVRDVTDRRLLEDQLRHDARHDSLTGLPNRAMFAESLDRLLGAAEQPVAVAFIDLDGFKEVNDTLGHACGDTVLQAVAAEIRRVVRTEDLVARLGGDEFALLMAHDGGPTPLPEVVHRVVQRVLEGVNVPLAVAGERITPAASIGVAFADGTTDAEQLLQRADVAMYQAKGSGRNRASWWDEGMHETVIERHLLARELVHAVGAGQLRLDYQPLVELPGSRTVGYEALVRWDRPGHGTVDPGIFIPIAEDTSAILHIGRWVLRQACADAVSWDPRPDGPTISVNLSARQLDTDDIVDHVATTLTETGLPAHRLELEVTETAMMRRPDAVATRLHAVRDLGVRVALDDFGVGYSSLSQLRGLPVDVLKIDRSFVSALGTSEEDRGLVAGIVSLARSLHLAIVAEGVETVEQAAIVSQLGCDRAQGFYFAEPMDASKVVYASKVHASKVHASKQPHVSSRVSLCDTAPTAAHR